MRAKKNSNVYPVLRGGDSSRHFTKGVARVTSRRDGPERRDRNSPVVVHLRPGLRLVVRKKT
jgi:hypothetical protein